jgi:hypothetical protein
MIRVEHHDGDERELEPERFFLAENTLEVKEVLDRWFGDTYTYFKVLADDGHNYILRHHRLTDTWDLIFTETDAPPPPPPSWPYSRPTSSRPS